MFGYVWISLTSFRPLGELIHIKYPFGNLYGYSITHVISTVISMNICSEYPVDIQSSYPNLIHILIYFEFLIIFDVLIYQYLFQVPNNILAYSRKSPNRYPYPCIHEYDIQGIRSHLIHVLSSYIPNLITFHICDIQDIQ